jgi:outer membrane protein assembly factor BamD (BamD/ComL family)
MTIVSKEQWTGEPMTKGYIFFGRKRPKNLEENLTAQKDQKYQLLLEAWYEEKDPELKKQKWEEAKEYWAKCRVELGFTEPEE